MRARPAQVSIAFCALLMAGCTGPGAPEPPPVVTETLGAISGLLIDDVYRPIPGALVFLQELGLTATTDADGGFQFAGLVPGSYLLVAQSPAHESAPANVDVVAGQYSEVELEARRIFSEGGHIITAQYSVFIPCAVDYVVNGYIIGCLADQSGDSWRPGFKTDVVAMGANITAMVHEAKMNQVGDYDLQVREANGASAGGERYAVAFLRDSDYMRIVHRHGELNTEHNGQGNNVPWTNAKPFDLLVFMSGEHRETFSGISDTTCNEDVDDTLRPTPVRTCNWRGVGARFGIKATFVQSLFLGPPQVDLATYQTLSAS